MSDDPGRPPTLNPSTRRAEPTEQQLTSLAWRFLGSEFASLLHANWPIDRRITAYLAHHGMTHIANDGDAYDAVLQHVLTNIGPAVRSGALTNTTRLMSWRPGAQTDLPDGRR